MLHLNKDNIRRAHNNDYNEILRVEEELVHTRRHHIYLLSNETRIRRRKLFPLYMNSILHYEHRVRRERRIALLAKLLSETCSATVRLDTTKSPPIRSAVFRRGTALCGKFSKPGEKMREREKARESFADSLKLLLSMPSASPAEATAPSCN